MWTVAFCRRCCCCHYPALVLMEGLQPSSRPSVHRASQSASESARHNRCSLYHSTANPEILAACWFSRKSPRRKSSVNLSIPDDATACLNKNRYTWSAHTSQNICKLFHLPQILGFTWSVSTATPIAAHTVDYPQGSMQNDGEGALQGHRVQSTPSLPRLSIQKFKIPTRVQLLFATCSGAP